MAKSHFSKSTQYVPGTVAGTEDIAMNTTAFFPVVKSPAESPVGPSAQPGAHAASASFCSLGLGFALCCSYGQSILDTPFCLVFQSEPRAKAG